MPTRVDSNQMFLFSEDPRVLAALIGLDWSAAMQLYQEDWLSFNPETAIINNGNDKAEFLFLGAMVAAGCESPMLKRLLSGLERPYRYDLRRIYYDWEERIWKDLSAYSSPEQYLEQVISDLEEDGDIDTLMEIADRLDDAIEFLEDEADEDDDNDDDDDDNSSAEMYDFNPADSSMVIAAKNLLLKLVGSPIAGSMKQMTVVEKFFQVFKKLPKVTRGLDMSIELHGPQLQFGANKINQWWGISIETNGDLLIDSGGYLERSDIDGDLLTTITWDVSPGGKPEYDNYLEPLSGDVTDTFENQVEALDLDDTDEYKLIVEDLSPVGETDE